MEKEVDAMKKELDAKKEVKRWEAISDLFFGMGTLCLFIVFALAAYMFIDIIASSIFLVLVILTSIFRKYVVRGNKTKPDNENDDRLLGIFKFLNSIHFLVFLEIIILSTLIIDAFSPFRWVNIPCDITSFLP